MQNLFSNSGIRAAVPKADVEIRLRSIAPTGKGHTDLFTEYGLPDHIRPDNGSDLRGPAVWEYSFTGTLAGLNPLLRGRAGAVSVVGTSGTVLGLDVDGAPPLEPVTRARFSLS